MKYFELEPDSLCGVGGVLSPPAPASENEKSVLLRRER